MKIILSLCLLLFAFHFSFTQNHRLIGLITYQNTGDPVNGVSITPTEGASPTMSNDVGQFELDFSQKSPGDIVKLILTKDEYQVVGLDPMIVEVALRQEAGEVVRIVMVKKIEYHQREGRIVETIKKELANMEKEILILRSQLIEKKLSEEERLESIQKIEALSQQAENLKKGKEELAKRLAQADLDQVPAFVKKALKEFEAGNLETALELMGDEKLDNNWDKVEKKLIQARKLGIDPYMHKTRMLSVVGQFEMTYKNYQKAIELDTTNLSNLSEFAGFCGILNQQKKAITLYQQALRHIKFEKDKANLLNDLGNEFRFDLQFDQAKMALKEALEIYELLTQTDPKSYELKVAITQNDLGILFTDVNEFDKAELAYSEALKILNRLVQSEPEVHEPYKARVLHNLGAMYKDLVVYDKAENAYSQSLEISKRLALVTPQRFEPMVASTQVNLGTLYRKLDDYNNAELAYSEALKIIKRLAQSNPQHYEPIVCI